ncbi:MAG: YebC/PmpR family DNA-binding transcriptional regulator [Candidatus Parcubacteria bacterium]|nr:YebC/PmpR family DNA-binding transcriptional regulator [Burkholderiales bacterium]
MAGHSKWANIKHRKAAADAKKGKVFTRLIKEITVAARMGGGDPDSNPRLRMMLDKARDANMTKDSVTRAVQRGTGELEGVDYEEIRYEGYGTGGAAVMVDCLTDNRTRTVAEVRHAFAKHGGNMGADGAVAFLFKHCGQFVFAPGASEDKIMEAALEAGAEDVLTNADGSIEVLSSPPEFDKVKAALEQAGLKPDAAEVTMKPLSETALAGAEAQKMRTLLDALDELDDVQNVYTTAALDE